MYEQNGEQVLHRRRPLPLLGREPGELGEGRRSSTPRAGSSASTPTWASGPPETHWPLEKFMKYSEEDFVKDVFEDGGVDARHLPVDVPEGVVHGRASTPPSDNAKMAEKYPGQADRQRPLGSARGRGRAQAARGGRQAYNLQGVKLYTAEWYKGSRGWTARPTRAQAVLRQVQGARDQEHPRPQGPDDLAAGQGRVRRQGHRHRRDRATPSSTSSSSTWGCRGSRTSASWRRRSRTSTPAWRW